MARHHDGRRVARIADPGLELEQLFEIEVVGGLVEQQQVRLRDPGACDQRQPLPAAAQRTHRQSAQIGRRLELVEHHVDAPLLAVPLFGWKRVEQNVVQRQVEQTVGNVLLHQRDAQTARADDVAGARLHEAGEAFQKGGFAGAVGGDEPEAVALADDEAEVLEQGRVGNERDIAKAQGSHGKLTGAARRQRPRAKSLERVETRPILAETRAR